MNGCESPDSRWLLAKARSGGFKIIFRDLEIVHFIQKVNLLRLSLLL
jgi:hypothetical protein